ncbi:MAG: CmpA/NrtA family ABC transporter substrate-binding protein [Verrucomicrobiota bacterium]
MGSLSSSVDLRVGFIPLLDAAPLIVAEERGFFEKAGLRVSLNSEPGWATIYDKFLFGELDAAHGLVGQALAMMDEAGPAAEQSPVACFLNRGGSYVVLSRVWTEKKVETAADLLVARRAMARGSQRLTFAAVNRVSSHAFLLEQWLKEGGLEKKDYQFVHLPPPLLARNLHFGHLDGFCAGEPWCAHSVAEGWGKVVASGEQLAPDYPDKVLLLSRELQRNRLADCRAFVRALMDAGQWCDEPKNHESLARMLSDDRYIGLSENLLRAALAGDSERGLETSGRLRFGGDAMQPIGRRLIWLAAQWKERKWSGGEHLAGLLDPQLFADASELEPSSAP